MRRSARLQGRGTVKRRKVVNGGTIKRENLADYAYTGEIEAKTEEIKTETLIVATEVPDLVVKKEEEEEVEFAIKKEDVPLVEKHKPFEPPPPLGDFDIEEHPEVLEAPGPKNWGLIYGSVKNMRQGILAPVDTMGCERLAESATDASPQVQRYQLLVSLMLSSQTKDAVTSQAVQNLREGLKGRGGLSVPGVLQLSPQEIDSYICKVGFHNRKAQYIASATQILRDRYDDDVPPTIAEMISLPGVGPKMAHLLMHRAWGRTEGIGVDVHVHRLANMWRWTGPKPAANPEHTRIALEKWLPRELWVDINPVLVGFGQTVCPPRGKNCRVCHLARDRLCSSSNWRPSKNGTPWGLATNEPRPAWMRDTYNAKIEIGYEADTDQDKSGNTNGL